MVKNTLTRRRFGAALIAATSVGLAGCGDNGNGDDDAATNESDDEDNESEEAGEGEFGTDPQTGDLTIHLENEDGEPVSSGVSIRVSQVDGNLNTTVQEEISDGEATVSLTGTGDYSITVESLEDEFEPVEETVTMEEDEDEGVLIELEGASGDEENGDEDGEDGEDDE
ncbi:Ig-like domain-containing protein [Natrononativus amylolyticus]|uniref:Ig-like domain-containing protein n=1 Tax=Natrononativus amylolyticus TaxID=2963434 RepID=UPI0020CEBB8F|nr:Ig-like domain-containing protein [Natrononativus amylolyticus]